MATRSPLHLHLLAHPKSELTNRRSPLRVNPHRSGPANIVRSGVIIYLVAVRLARPIALAPGILVSLRSPGGPFPHCWSVGRAIG